MEVKGEKTREFFLLAISGAISEKGRRRNTSFVRLLSERLTDLRLRIILFHELNKTLKIDVVKGSVLKLMPEIYLRSHLVTSTGM